MCVKMFLRFSLILWISLILPLSLHARIDSCDGYKCLKKLEGEQLNDLDEVRYPLYSNFYILIDILVRSLYHILLHFIHRYAATIRWDLTDFVTVVEE